MTTPSTVLLVEDERMLGTVIERLLKRAGWLVERVASVREAAGVEGSFEVGLFDIELGDGLGTDLAERMLARGRVGAVVFYTATYDEALLGAARELGRVVPKSQSFDGLFEALAAARAQATGEPVMPSRSGTYEKGRGRRQQSELPKGSTGSGD